MADTRRDATNTWFQRTNHLRLKREELNMRVIFDAAVTRAAGLGKTIANTARGVATWSPADLFPTGTEEGLFLDFSDISTLYTDQTFATNISAIGDPVGGVIDKSQGLVLGAEKLTNGGFDTDLTGWTAAAGFSVSGGKLIGATSGDKIYQAAGITAGEVYSFTITGVVGEWGVRLGQDAANDYTITADGTYFITPGTLYSTTDFRLRVNIAGSELASISVKKLSGNHLIQATSTARPIWTRHPKSGVRNLIDQNELLNGPKWGTPSAGAVTRTALGNTGPNGVQAWRLAGNNANSWLSNILPGDASAVPGTRALSVWVRFVGAARPATPLTLFFYNPGGSPTENLRIDTLMTEEWQRITHTSSTAWSAATLHIGINVGNGATDGHVVEVAGFQTELDATATSYQTRVSQYDVTEAGVDDCYGLTFDGVDDYLVTAAAVDFGSPSTATFTTGQFTGVEHVGYVFTFGGPTRPRLSVSQETNRWRSAAEPSLTGGGSTDTPASSAPSAAVVSVLASASAGNSHRIDGEEYSTTSAGTGVFSQNTNIFIGKSWTAAYYFTGTIYGVTLTDYTLDAEQLAELETWTAARTPEVFLWPRDFLGLTGTHDYYIDATLGNDSNDGSEGAPWASLSKLEAVDAGGGTLRALVKAGTYDTASDHIDFGAGGPNGTLEVAFEPGCVLDGTVHGAASQNPIYLDTGTLKIYGNGLTVQNFNGTATGTPNGLGYGSTATLIAHDVTIDTVQDGISGHANGAGFFYDCHVKNAYKLCVANVDNSTMEAYRCLFDMRAPGLPISSSAGLQYFEDCVFIAGASDNATISGDNQHFVRCQLGDITNHVTPQQRTLGSGTLVAEDCFINVDIQAAGGTTYTRCYGFMSARTRNTAGAFVVQDSVLIGGQNGGTNILYCNSDFGGSCQVLFTDNVIETANQISSFNATQAGYVIAASSSISGNQLFGGAAWDADLAPVISGTITTDPQIGSADSYLMADYASAAGLAGFGSGDVVERPAAIPRELRDTI